MAEDHEFVELGNSSYNRSASSSLSVYHSTRIQGLVQSRTDYETAIDFEIAASKGHWSELRALSVVEDSSGGEKENVPLTNEEIVLSLRRQFPQIGNFFFDFSDSVVLGKKIAEAEIFEAKLKGSSLKFVLKVFKEGSSVMELQKQWPLGMLNRCKKAYFSPVGCSPVLSETVVMNGRFAFRMVQCAEAH